jgi:hypothetical protein
MDCPKCDRCDWGCDDIENQKGRSMEPLCNDQNLPKVAGNLNRPIVEVERALLIAIKEEQGKINPDKFLLGALCDAVRIGREYVKFMDCLI